MSNVLQEALAANTVRATSSWQGDRPSDVPVAALRPYVNLVPRANELRRDSNLVAIASNATLKYTVHAQFLANLLDAFRSMLVRHRRGCVR